MALVDDPPAFILRMFEMETREGRGQFCEVFPRGTAPDGWPLAAGELVFGIYKGRYAFAAQSLVLLERDGPHRIPWASIEACSTQHGQGAKKSILTLDDGEQITIAMRDLATGWSGRISQLFHGMIDRWGAPNSGFGLMSVDAFLEKAEDGRSFGVNMDPPPTVATLREWLHTLATNPMTRSLQVVLGDPEGETEVFADQLVIVTVAGQESLAEIATMMGAADVGPAPQEILRRLGPLQPFESAFVFWWD